MPRPKGSANKNRSELIELALAGLDIQIQQAQSQLDALMAKRRELSRPSGSRETPPSAPVSSKKKAGTTSSKKRKKRQVSEETRQKLKEAAQARWARQREEA